MSKESIKEIWFGVLRSADNGSPRGWNSKWELIKARTQLPMVRILVSLTSGGLNKMGLAWPVGGLTNEKKWTETTFDCSRKQRREEEANTVKGKKKGDAVFLCPPFSFLCYQLVILHSYQ